MENQQPQMPQTYMWQSVVVTLLCCLPFGIAGIVNANKVSSLYAAGQYEEAQKASAQAWKWTKIGLILGIVAYVLSFIITGGSIFAMFAMLG